MAMLMVGMMIMASVDMDVRSRRVPHPLLCGHAEMGMANARGLAEQHPRQQD